MGPELILAAALAVAASTTTAIGVIASTGVPVSVAVSTDVGVSTGVDVSSGVFASTAARAASGASVVLVAVGDIRLDGPVGLVAALGGFGAPTAKIREALRADILFGNLETPITTRGLKHFKKYNFRAPPKSLAILREAGFSIVNLANNHVWDYGERGLLDTLAALRETDLPHVGAGKDLEEAQRPVILERSGVRVGWLGFTSTFPSEAWARANKPGVAFADFGRFPEVVRRAKDRCDVLVVSFHGGDELAPEPNAVQRDFAHAAVDAGADLVIGHHPHVLQPIEEYKGRFILYSLGNFLFVGRAARWSALARVRLSRDGIESIEFEPLDTWFGQPHPPSKAGAVAAWAALDAWGTLTANPGRLRFLEPSAP